MAILYEDYIKDKEKYDIYTPPKKKTTTKAKQNNNGYFKKSKGNTGQAIGYSALDALGNFTEGSLNFFEGMSDSARYAGANVLDFFGADKKAEEIRKRAKENDVADIVKQANHIFAGDLAGTKSEEEIGHFKKVEDNSIFGEKSDQVMQGVGNSLTGAVVGSYLGTPITGAGKGANLARNAIGLTSFGSSAAGHATTEAYNEGANDFQAGVYGILNGAVESGSEMLFGGLGKINKSLGFATGALDDVIVKKLTKNIGNTLVRNISTIGLKSAGEGVEEIASLLGNQLVRRMMDMDSKTLKELAEDGTLVDTFVQGTLSSLISQTPSGISSTVQGRDYTTGLTNTQRKYVNEIAQQRMVEAQKRNAKLRGIEKSRIEDRALTDYQQGRLADASKLNLPGLSTKDMDLQQSAYKYGFNPNSEVIVTAKTMLDNRGIKSRFDADAFKKINGNAYWTNNNGVREVIFNPNASEQAILEEIAIHELTHDLMSSKNSKSLLDKQNIIDYVSTLKGYKESRAKLEDLYSKQTKGMNKQKAVDLINEEIVADTLGKNIGSQEYIRRLIDDEPSIAKNIYDWVVNKVVNNKGVKNEKAYWNNVKNNFEKAYNMEYQGKGSEGSAKYSIGGEKGFNNLTDSEKRSVKWYQDKNGDWKFEFSDSEMNLLEDLDDIKPGKEYTINELFNHKLLTKMYPDLQEYKIVFEDLGTANGKHNFEEKIIRVNTNKLNYKNLSKNEVINAQKFGMNNYEYAKTQVESTLLHEIQHAIQKIEGFETGRGTRYFKKAYLESLGEIEANDTKLRYILERGGKLDRNKIAPESSKSNPIHKDINGKSNLEYYLKNRSNTRKILDNLYDKYGTQIDKFMEKAYNFFNKEGMSDEEINLLVEEYQKENLQKNSKKTIRNVVRRGTTLEGTSDSSFYYDLIADAKFHNAEDLTEVTTGYENVPDNLLGFSSSSVNNKGYNEEKYKYKLDLMISFDDGKTYFEDSIKGLNKKQAIERARRNWGEDAILKANPSSEDADIRYSLSDTGKTGTLMAIHNLNEQKLKGILELGGFPVPSIAVTNPNLVNHDEFGDMSVLFDKTTIDPKNKKNEIYDRDIWSPTFPRVEYEADSKRLKEILKSININPENYHNLDSLQRKAELDLRKDNLERMLDNYGLDGLKDSIKKNRDVQYSYLKTKGLIEPVYKAHQYNREVSNEVLQQFLEQYQGSTDFSWTTPLNELDYDQTMALSDTIKRIVRPYLEEQFGKYGKDGQKLVEDMVNSYNNFSALDKFIYSAKSMERNGIDRQELDETATLEKAEKVLDKEEYDKWVDETFDDIIGQKGIRNDKDIFTPSGSRRSFKATHNEINLENLVKAMTKGRTKGGQETSIFGTGFGRVSAQTSQQFKSIEDIKANESRLMTREEAGEIIQPLAENLFTKVGELANFYTRKDYGSDMVNHMQGVDVTSELIEEFAGGTLSEERLTRLLKEYMVYDVNNIPTELLTGIVEDLNTLKNLPTDYFESKPQRAVGLDEVQAIVIPNTTSTEFKQQLQDAGLKYYEYDPNIEGDRQRVINQFEDLKFSKQNEDWQSFLDKNFEAKGTKTRLDDIKLPGLTKAVQEEVQKQTSNALLPIANELKELNKNLTKVMNPSEIAQLTPQDANTTPILPGINRNKVGDGKSKFFDNIKDKTNMLSDETKTAILSSDDVKYYDKVTNKESLDKAYARLQENGQAEVEDWFNKTKQTDGKDARQVTAVDVAEGWILLKQVNDAIEKETDPIRKHQLLQSSVNYAINLRDIGSKAGQVIQAFNILSRLTPEGMVYYAQKELSQAYDEMVKNKTKAWIDENKSKFELQPNEVQFILDTMKDVSTMEDGRAKDIKLAQIQAMMKDKLPPSKGAGIRAWMRISMLFNPKTLITRNPLGNALMVPVNAVGDVFASGVDKLISQKTGVRTKGNMNVQSYGKGFVKGAKNATQDYLMGINTRNIEGNRFELTEGKSFNEQHKGMFKGIRDITSKGLNKADNMLGYVLDIGDRTFYEGSFENSLKNQMVLNNTTEVTQDMIDIATQEALSRTWQDNSEYTKAVLGIRNLLNKANIRGYGLGDVLIPFAKTPANLTKAIVDYSPAGLVSAITKGVKLSRSLTNGQYSAKTQHEFVESLGKAFAGTALYVLGLALANSGIISGDSDEDKDVSNFLKNTLGINSYSIKIGDKSFTYDWAQPIAAPLSIMANIVNSKDKDAALIEGIVGSLDSAGSILLEQSFLQSINDVLNNQDGVISGLITEGLELPARAVPTFLKQIADLVDGTQRQTFEYGKPVKSAFNQIITKIPGLSQTLAPSVDTLGREIQKYGGKNNPFNVFLNPANVNTENISKSGQEIYRLYKETGETNIMPRVAPYYVNKEGKKIVLDTKQRAQYQKVSGSIIESNVAKLLELTEYKNMSDKDKASVVNDIVNYSYNIAQNQVLGTELTKEYERAYEYSKIGDMSDYYAFTNSIDDKNADTKRESVFNYLYNSELDDNQIAALYSKYYSTEQKLDNLLTLKIPMRQFIKFDLADIQGEYNPKTGKTISGSKKNAVIRYVNDLEGLSKAQKAIIIKSTKQFKFDNYNNDIIRYVNNLSGTANDKKVWLKSIGFDNYDKDVVRYIKSQGLSREETEKKLKDLGFTIRDGRVYY